MEESKTITPNQTTITNILTLRYDPTQKPLLSKLKWQDFIDKIPNPSIDFIQQTIENYFRNEIPSNNNKVSIALSGGVDSSLILAILKNLRSDITIEAISLKFAESIDETLQAEKIAQKLEVNHNIIYLENFLSELPKAISIIKLPFWDLHWYHIAKKAKELSKYLVAGDGGDELFGGYTFRYKKFLSLVNQKSTPIQKIKAYLECHERDIVPDQEKLFGNKIQFSWNAIYNNFTPYFDNAIPILEQVFLADFNGKFLYNFLPINTAFDKFFDVKPLAPIMSQKMISYSVHIPAELKYDKGNTTGKILLRKLLDKFGLNDFVSSNKLGFSVNTVNLWQSYGKNICDYYLSNSQIAKAGWINQDWITKYIDKKELDVRYVNKFLGLLAFEIWYRLFVTKDMKSNTILE